MFGQQSISIDGLYSKIIIGLSVPLLFTLIRALRRRRQQRLLEAELSTQYECQDPRILRGKWPFSLDLLLEAVRADRANQILRLFVRILEGAGTTHAQSLLGSRAINTVDPENIEAILSTQFERFYLGAREENFRPLLGDGIFTQSGPAWKQSRDILRPIFNDRKTEYFFHIKNAVNILLLRLKEEAARSVVDLQPLFFLLTLDVTTAAVLGSSTNSLQDQGSKVGLQFADAFDQGQHYLAIRGRLGDFYWVMGGKKFKKACKFVHGFVDNIVSDGLKRKNQSHKEDLRDEGYLFIDALMRETRDTKVIRDQLVNVLLAGRDTTACLLSWTFRLLAQHPDIQERLREECVSLPSHTDGDLPTKDELKNMRFLNKVIKEGKYCQPVVQPTAWGFTKDVPSLVLRLYPSVPVNVRQALKATVLPVGGGPDGRSPLLVRRQEAVGYSVYVMHRRKDLYGEDADKFRPDRWDPNPSEGPDLKNIGWGYLPFNRGPRICLGQEFAMLEASYAIVRLLQTFKSVEPAEIETAEEREYPKHTVTLVVASANGCKVRMTV